MPFAIVSHQGLILPLWRWRPGRIDAVALCVGAAMPDVVDGAAWPFRGEVGHWLGHSLVGLAVCVPAGLALTELARRVGPRRLVARLEEGSPGRSWPRAAASVAIGTLSHLASDLVTHGRFVLLWPWLQLDRPFPEWWYHSFGSIPLIYRRPYPLAPHTISWILVSILGAVLFFRCLRARR